MMRSSREEEATYAHHLRSSAKRCEAVCKVTAMPASRPLGFSRDWEIYHDEARKGDPLGERRKAGMRMHTGLIAVSFHRLFLGGLLPSRARFRFAGYCLGISCDGSRQACS
jgi:hypothetical protein